MTALIPYRVWESGWTPAASCAILFIIIILIIYCSPATGEKGNRCQVHSKFKALWAARKIRGGLVVGKGGPGALTLPGAEAPRAGGEPWSQGPTDRKVGWHHPSSRASAPPPSSSHSDLVFIEQLCSEHPKGTNLKMLRTVWVLQLFICEDLSGISYPHVVR